jgi:hypothetical protein
MNENVKKTTEEGIKVFAEAVIGTGQGLLKAAQEIAGLTDEKAKKIMQGIQLGEAKVLKQAHEANDSRKGLEKDPVEKDVSNYSSPKFRR